MTKCRGKALGFSSIHPSHNHVSFSFFFFPFFHYFSRYPVLIYMELF